MCHIILIIFSHLPWICPFYLILIFSSSNRRDESVRAPFENSIPILIPIISFLLSKVSVYISGILINVAMYPEGPTV